MYKNRKHLNRKLWTRIFLRRMDKVFEEETLALYPETGWVKTISEQQKAFKRNFERLGMRPRVAYIVSSTRVYLNVNFDIIEEIRCLTKINGVEPLLSNRNNMLREILRNTPDKHHLESLEIIITPPENPEQDREEYHKRIFEGTPTWQAKYTVKGQIL